MSDSILEELNKAKSDLSLAEKQQTTMKEVKPKQVKPAANKKPKTTHKYKGKTVKELDEKDCEDLLKETKERRAKAAKAEKKSKSRPIIEKVTAPIVKSVKKAIENISAADLKDNPTGELSRIEKAIAATKRFMMELKTILGEDFDKDTVEDEMKELHALAKELNKKYGDIAPLDKNVNKKVGGSKKDKAENFLEDFIVKEIEDKFGFEKQLFWNSGRSSDEVGTYALDHDKESCWAEVFIENDTYDKMKSNLKQLEEKLKSASTGMGYNTSVMITKGRDEDESSFVTFSLGYGK